MTNGCALGPVDSTHLSDSNPTKSAEDKVPVIDVQSVCRPVSVKLVRCDDAESLPEEPVTPPRRYPKRNRAPPPMYKYEQNATRVVRPRKTKPSESDYFDSWSNCIVAYRYDMEKNFFPEPGPSTVNYYVGVDLPGYYTPVKPHKRVYSRSRKTTDASSSESEISRTPTPKRKKKRGRKPKTAIKRLMVSPERQPSAVESTPQNAKMTPGGGVDDCEDIMMKSFYVDSPSFLHNTLVDSPLPEPSASPMTPSLAQTAHDTEDPLLLPAISNLMTCISRAPPVSPALVEVAPSAINDESALTRIHTTESAPSRIEVTNALAANEFPQVVNKRPFYSNPKDVSQSNRTEVGHTVLLLGGDAINDCEPFASTLNIVGLNSWRKLTMSNMIVPINGKKQSNQPHSIEHSRELLASDRLVTIMPNEAPPSLSDTNKWIRSRNRMLQKKRSPSPAAPVVTNGNGYHVNEHETIVIDDDSEPEMVITNGCDDSERSLSNGTSDAVHVNGFNRTTKTEHVEDVICLDDSDDDDKIGSHFQISIFSSPSTGSISLKDGIDKIAKEVVGAVSTERNFS